MSASEPNAGQTSPASSPRFSETTWVVGDGLVPGDAYEEGSYIVFTAQYHLRRGYCCNSACRHCPYRAG